MIGYNIPVQTAAQGWGTAVPLTRETALQNCPMPGTDAQAGCRMWGLDKYNPHRTRTVVTGPLGRRARYYGPPFQDPQLQSTYLEESRRLASGSAVITLGTARELVATVINAALAAADAAVPEIEARVRREAGSAAKVGVGKMFLGAAAVTALGLSVLLLFKTRRR